MPREFILRPRFQYSQQLLQSSAPEQGLSLLDKEVEPPMERLVLSGEELLVSVWNSASAVSLSILVRMLYRQSGVIQTVNLGQPTMTTDRTEQDTTFTMPEGFILGVTVAVSGTLKRGQCYVRIGLKAPAVEGENVVGQLLFQDYVSTGFNPVYPNGRIQSPTEGNGYLTSYSSGEITGPTGASVFVPNNARWKIRSVLGSLATSSASGSRSLILYVDEIICVPTTTTGPSAETDYYYVPSFGGSADRSITTETETTGPPFGYVVAGGSSISARIFNGSSGDKTTLTVYVEEFIDV